MRPASLVPLQRLWRRLPSGKHAGLWPLLLAAPILIALLLAFHAVVRGAVLRGELYFFGNNFSYYLVIITIKALILVFI